MSKIEAYLETEPNLVPHVVAFVIENNQVLLGVRKISSLGLGVGKTAGLGGKHEPGESDREALLRELQEEVGIEVKEYEHRGTITFLNPDNPEYDMIVQVFIVSAWKNTPEESEETKPEWFDINEVPYERMFSDNEYWLPRVLEGQQVDAVFLFEKTDMGEEILVEKQIAFS